MLRTGSLPAGSSARPRVAHDEGKTQWLTERGAGGRWLAPLLVTIAVIVLVLPGGAVASSGVSISGSVTSSASASIDISGAEVTITTSSASGPVVATATTTASGYSVTVPRNGDYVVSVSDSGYVGSSTNVTVGASSATANLVVTPASFFGTVTDAASNSAVRAETVELLQSGNGTTYSLVDSTTTDRDGDYAFPSADFSTGDYKLEYVSSSHAYATADYAGGTALTTPPTGGCRRGAGTGHGRDHRNHRRRNWPR